MAFFKFSSNNNDQNIELIKRMHLIFNKAATDFNILIDNSIIFLTNSGIAVHKTAPKNTKQILHKIKNIQDKISGYLAAGRTKDIEIINMLEKDANDVHKFVLSTSNKNDVHFRNLQQKLEELINNFLSINKNVDLKSLQAAWNNYVINAVETNINFFLKYGWKEILTRRLGELNISIKQSKMFTPGIRDSGQAASSDETGYNMSTESVGNNGIALYYGPMQQAMQSTDNNNMDVSLVDDGNMAKDNSKPGDCFGFANNFARKNGGVICHGQVILPSNKIIDHAWVEKNNKIYDYQNFLKNNKTIDKDVFYKALCPFDITRYTADQATINMLKTMHHGPWSSQELLSKKAQIDWPLNNRSNSLYSKDNNDGNKYYYDVDSPMNDADDGEMSIENAVLKQVTHLFDLHDNYIYNMPAREAMPEQQTLKMLMEFYNTVVSFDKKVENILKLFLTEKNLPSKYSSDIQDTMARAFAELGATKNKIDHNPYPIATRVWETDTAFSYCHFVLERILEYYGKDEGDLPITKDASTNIPEILISLKKLQESHDNIFKHQARSSPVENVTAKILNNFEKNVQSFAQKIKHLANEIYKDKIEDTHKNFIYKELRIIFDEIDYTEYLERTSVKSRGFALHKLDVAFSRCHRILNILSTILKTANSNKLSKRAYPDYANEMSIYNEPLEQYDAVTTPSFDLFVFPGSADPKKLEPDGSDEVSYEENRKTIKDLNMADDNNKLSACLIKGNAYYVNGNPFADAFYKNIADFLEDLDYSVKIVNAEDSEIPKADLWIGHSKGVNKLRKYDKHDIELIGFGALNTKHQNKNLVIVNHEADEKFMKNFSIANGTGFGEAPTDEHYIFTDEMKDAIKAATNKIIKKRI